MFLINYRELEAGDILLIRFNTKLSKNIRQYSKSQYSHAFLYVGLASLIEADGLGVQSQNIQRVLVEKEDDIVLLRLKSKVSNEEMQKVIEFARITIGTEYSPSEARLSNKEKDITAKNPNRQFCTRFVAQAYLNAGIKIVSNPDYCTPEEVLQSPLLQIKSNFLKQATQEEIIYAQEENTVLIKQMDIHNEIFESARNIFNYDIQNFPNLEEYILLNHNKKQEIDKITQIIEASGYLTLWQIDVQKNPGYYDYSFFLSHFVGINNRKKVANFLISTDNSRFFANLEAAKIRYSYFQQRYFLIMIALYETLINLSQIKINVGLQALKDLKNMK